MNADRSSRRGQDGPSPTGATGQTVRLVCDGCGAVDDGDGPIEELTAHLRHSHGFEPRSAEVTVFGRCRHCRPG